MDYTWIQKFSGSSRSLENSGEEAHQSTENVCMIFNVNAQNVNVELFTYG